MTDPSVFRAGAMVPWVALAGGVGLLVAVIVEWRMISQLREENVVLRAECEAAVRQVSSQTATTAAAQASELEQIRKEKLELMAFREELERNLRYKPASTTAAGETVASPSSSTTATAANTPTDEARQLLTAAMQGNPSALNQLAKLVAALRTMTPEEQAAARSKIQSAFEWLGREAGIGNAAGLQALWAASRVAELKGYAVKALGQAAGMGNEEALEPLLEPERYLLLHSSATSALKPAADAGNERAIAALAATAAEPRHQGLWLMAVQGMEGAAAAGNDLAIDSLARIAATANTTVSKQAILALEAAARAKQPRAEEALRKLGWR